MGNDDWADQVAKQIEEHVKKNFPEGVSVPTDGSEDEAVRAVQKQFEDRGFGCPDATARDIVRRARGNSE
ncbi:hypothetical protein AWB92_24770 [Mycobacterium sp. IEC1808]|uniref:hypothetical protein n=1 Tax=Mycobacterium sp. IEC1808 TaxID=1743230 RepID=UPI000A158879|nr:hypothetical protein [Mycobacterium sp. IEC1808]ORW86902.1 hypothetical protein AWB92_24770 [Mycobacterium sp. IEC1808]